MKAKVGISIAAGALAVGLAGTALAADPAAQGAQQALPGSEQGAQQVHPGYGAQQALPGPSEGAQQAQMGPSEGAHQAQMGPDEGAQQVQPEPDAEEQEWDYGKPEAIPSPPPEIVPAPCKALEIGVSAGYTQGFGKLGGGVGVGRVADAGFALGLNLSYRVSPMFSVGVTTQGQVFDADKALGRGGMARGMTAGLDATIHLAPFSQVDPFISLGTGYRLLWTKAEVSKGHASALTHGFQIARLNVGADVRVSKDVAIGPMIGADLNTFVWTNPAGDAGDQQIKDKGVSTFIYAGIQGRFDVGGTRQVPMD